MNVDVVFQGGGVLGISYIGVLKALKEKGYNIQRCAGTSAGSIVAALTAVGYNWEELYTIVKNTDFSVFMKKTNLSRFLYLGKILSVIFKKGIYDSEILSEWIEKLLKDKGKTSFEELLFENKSKLKVISSDITNQEIVILPDSLDKSEEIKISEAIRMSCAIPFFYTPVTIKKNDKVNYLVDGGLLSNFPIWVFDVEGVPRWPTFGVKIIKKNSLTYHGKKDILSYFIDVVKAPLNYDSIEFVRNKDKVRTIEIEIDRDISSKDFKKSNEFIEYLFKQGYNAGIRFIEQWNFSSYVEKYRIPKEKYKL